MPSVTRRELVALAAPAAAAAILYNAPRVIGQYASQDLGIAAEAAVGSCAFVLVLQFALYALVSAGTGPLVARATGAGDDRLRRELVGNALLGATVAGLASGALVWVGAPWIAGALGLSGPSADAALTYLRGGAIIALPLALQPVLDAAFIAMGRTAAAMVLQIVAVGANVAAVGPLAGSLGVVGIPLATGIGRGVAVGVGLLLLVRAIGLHLRDLRLNRTVLRIARVGCPIAVNSALYAGVYWALLRFAVSPLGPAVNAGLGIGFSALEGFTWPLFMGISLGVASVVGRRLGAGEPEEAAAAVRLGVPMSLGLGGVAALAFWFGAEPLCGLFTQDPRVLAEAVVYARVLAFSQIFVALEALAEGALEGSGDTGAVFRWSAPLNVLRVPLGWALALPLGWGAAGVWWAINLTTLAKALGKGWSVARGGWLRVRV